jgi:hypothetical protein
MNASEPPRVAITTNLSWEIILARLLLDFSCFATQMLLRLYRLPNSSSIIISTIANAIVSP